MPSNWKVSTDLFREIAKIVLGIVLAIVPLALWVAWSEMVFVIILAVGAVAMILILAVSETEPEVEQNRPKQVNKVTATELIAEMHRLMPFTFHHRRLDDPRLRRKFAALRALMRRPDA